MRDKKKPEDKAEAKALKAENTAASSKAENKKDKKFNSKKLKHGAMATAFTCVFIAAIVLVNVIATVIFDKFPITFDLTENKIYSVSEEAEEFVKKIDKQVTVTVLATRDEFESFGSEYTKTAAELLDKYRKYNDNIEVNYIDFLSNPDILSDYADQEGINAYDIIFETKSTDSEGNEFKRVKVVGLMDMVNIDEEVMDYLVQQGYDSATVEAEIETYVMSYGHYQTFNTYYGAGMLGTSNAENAFVGAFMAVADDNPVTVTFLNSNRQETQLAYFKSLLDANGYIVNEINISTDEIPEDSSVLVMPAPKLDYTAEEIEKIDKFLDNDGDLGKNLIYISSVEQDKTPNIDEFLEEYGLKVERAVIMEEEAGYYYSGNPYLTRQFLVGEYYLESFNGSADAYFYVPYSRAVTPLFEEDGMKTVWKYLASSSNAYKVDMDAEESEQSGILYSMAIGAKGKFVSDEYMNHSADFSHILAFGSDGFFSDAALAASQFENSDLIISMLNEITDKQEGPVITPKAVNAVRFDVNEKQANVLKYVYIFVIPGITFIIGLVIYLRRKNK